MEINHLISNLFLSQRNNSAFKAGDYVSIKDKLYLDFLETHNGGFYFNQALHLYSAITVNSIPNITDMNILLFSQYQQIVKDLTFFGQDIFGNQFAFEKNKVLLFNIESGEREYLGNSFSDFILKLKEDGDYYTGLPYYLKWVKKKIEIKSE